MSRIRILVTTDVHGYIYPYNYSDSKEFFGGYGRVKTIIDTYRDENTIVLDNGDVLEGSALSFYHYHNSDTEISPMTIAMKDIGYDYINVGNHDFNYGEKELLKHLNNTGSTCITCNWHYQDKPFSSYVIKEINDKKIAIFGLVTQYIPHWEKEENIKDTTFIDALECCKQIVQTIKKKEDVDYIVCLYHGGFERNLETGLPSEALTGENEAYQMIQEIDGIDVMLTGHQHRTLCGKLKNTVYTQTTCNGKEVACVDIDTETNDISARIIPCDQPADASLLSDVQKEEDACQTWLDQPLGTSSIDLCIHDEDDARLHKSQLITFLNKVVLEKTHADISSTALFLHATGFHSSITMRDIVSTYVYPNTLVVKKVSGKTLKEYLEKNSEYFVLKNNEIVVNPSYIDPKPRGFDYDMLDGIAYTMKIGNPIGNRIISLTRNGIPIKEDDTFALALNNYRASGGGNFEMLKNAETIQEHQDSMVDILAEYIMKHKNIDFEEVNNIEIIQ